MTNQQLRKHLKRSWLDRLRISRLRQKLGFCGKGAYVDKNVAFMRYPKLVSLGRAAVVKEGARICPCNPYASVTIGERTTIGYHTFIFASERISIGNDCLIAPFVYIVDSDHGIDKEIPINQQPNQTASIIIEDDVWVATGAKILKGVTVHQGSIIAAGAIVNQDVPPYTIVGGMPAKTIGERK